MSVEVGELLQSSDNEDSGTGKTEKDDVSDDKELLLFDMPERVSRENTM